MIFGGWKGPMALTFVFSAPIVATAIFLVWTRVTTLHLGYELAELQKNLKALQEENSVLGTEVGALRSPERLQRLARRLGFKPPVLERSITVSRGKIR